MQYNSTSPSYQLGHKIGSGSFGKIFKARNIFTGESVAIKVEKKNTDIPQLAHEASFYSHLHHKNSKPTGIPQVFQFTTQADYSLLIMELLGPSLEELFNQCGRRFSLKTVLMLADQMISRLEYTHNCGIVHRDIKPENFVLGKGDKENTIYLIDFGLSKLYMKEGKHVDPVTGKNFIGTARYASLNTHRGLGQSRRDDLEAVAYVWIYFLKGSLPWQGIKLKERSQRYEKVKEKKTEISVEELCRNLPTAFAEYLNYVKNLEYTEKPNYLKLRMLFKNLFYEKGYKEDFDFDWISRKKVLFAKTCNSLVTTAEIEDNRAKMEEVKNEANKHLLAPKISNVTTKSTLDTQGNEENSKACFSLFKCFI